MRKRFGLKTSLIAAVAVAGVLAGQASGATISFSGSFGPSAVPFSAAPLVTLSEFDPALGTLTKVTFTLDADVAAGSIDWDNEAEIPTDVTLGIGAEVTAVAPAALTAVAVPLSTGSAIGIDADNDGAADFVGTDSFSVTGGTGSDTDTVISTVPAVLLSYTGLGTFDVTVSSVVSTFLTTTGGFGPIDSSPGTTSGTATVTYEYTFIPEPATAGIALVMLCGLSMTRRSRK